MHLTLDPPKLGKKAKRAKLLTSGNIVEASVGLACPRVSWGSVPLPVSGDKADDLAFDQA